MAAIRAGHVQGSPVFGLKLGACSCLLFTGRPPELSEEQELAFRRPPTAPVPGGYSHPQDGFGSQEQLILEHRPPAALHVPDGAAPCKPHCFDEDFTTLELPGKPSLPNDDHAEVPPLGPVGCGGWQMEAGVTEAMRKVRGQALEQLEREENVQLPKFHLDFLTPATLVNYVEPASPQYLVTALKHRIQMEEVLTVRKPIYLWSSARVIGWDSEGSSILSVDLASVKNGMSYGMDQIEYVGWTALDLNKPGANGMVCVWDFGGPVSTMYFLNPKPLISLASLIEGQWRRRLKAAYLVEQPSSFARITRLFMKLIKQTTRDKIHFVSSVDALREKLQEIGCEQESIDACLAPMRKHRDRGAEPTWSPVVDHPFFRRELGDLGWDQDVEYLTEAHHLRLRQTIQRFHLWKWGLPAAWLDLSPSSRGSSRTVEKATTAAAKAAEGAAGYGAPAAMPRAAGKTWATHRSRTGVARAASAKRAAPRSFLRRIASCCLCGACGK